MEIKLGHADNYSEQLTDTINIILAKLLIFLTTEVSARNWGEIVYILYRAVHQAFIKDASINCNLGIKKCLFGPVVTDLFIVLLYIYIYSSKRQREIHHLIHSYTLVIQLYFTTLCTTLNA